MAPAPTAFLPIAWDDFHSDTRALARLLADKSITGIAGIARGGLVPAAIIAHELGIRLVDSLCIASYDGKVQGETRVLKGIAGDGSGMVVIDDLVDTGATARMVRKALPKAYLAAVYAKPAGHRDVDCYVKLVSQETWIVFPWEQVA